MKTKLILLPIGASVIAAGTACSVISCGPESSVFKVEFVAPPSVSISNKDAELNVEFLTIVDISTGILKETPVEVYVNGVLLTQGEEYTWQLVTNPGQYELKIPAEKVTSRQIKVVINLEGQATVEGSVSDSSPQPSTIELSNKIATEEHEYKTDITVKDTTGKDWLEINKEDPLTIYVDSTEIKKDVGYKWESDSSDFRVSHLTIYSSAIPAGTQEIKIIANLKDREDLLEISYEGVDQDVKAKIGFSGEQDGSYVFKTKDGRPVDEQWLNVELIPEGTSTSEIGWNETKKKIQWSAVAHEGEYKYRLKAIYHDDKGHHLECTTQQVITLSFEVSEIDVTLKTDKIDNVHEEKGKSSATVGTLKIDGKETSQIQGVTEPTYSLKSEGGSDLTNITIDEKTGVVNVAPAIIAGTYTFKIHATAQNTNLSSIKYEADSQLITLTVDQPVLAVSGGSTQLTSKEGESGTDQNAWSFQFDSETKTSDVTWSLDVSSGSTLPSGLKIDEDGHVYWDTSITSGTYKFFVKGEYKSKITGKSYECKSTEITFESTAEDFNVTGTKSLDGTEGVGDNSVSYIAKFGGDDVTTEATWELKNTIGTGEIPEGMTLGEKTGILSWGNNIRADAKDNYNFTVTAKYHGTSPEKDYEYSITDIKFNLQEATMTWEVQGAQEIYGVYEGDAYDGGQNAWACAVNGKSVGNGVTYTKETVLDGETDADIDFVDLVVNEGQAKTSWEVDKAHIRQGDDPNQDFKLVAHYTITSIQKEVTTEAVIKMKIDPKEASITYNGSTEPALPNIIESTDGADDTSFICNYGGQPWSETVTWSITNVQPATAEGKIQIDEEGKLSWGKIEYTEFTPPEQDPNFVTFNVVGAIDLPWQTGRMVTSKPMTMAIVPLQFNLTPSEPLTNPIEGREGIAGDSGALAFSTTVGPAEGQSSVVTDKTTFEIVSDSEEVKAALSVNQNGKIEWDDSLKHVEGGYKFKVKATYTAENSNRTFTQTSDEVTLDLVDNELELVYGAGATEKTAPEFKEYTWDDAFKPCWKGTEEIVSKTTSVEFTGNKPAGLEPSFDTTGAIRPKVSNEVGQGTYTFEMKVTYKLDNIGETYSDTVSLTLNVTAQSLVISGGPDALTTEEWTEGTDTQNWQVMMDDQEVTKDCNYELVNDEGEDKTGDLPSGSVSVTKNSGLTTWNNNIQAGIYYFHFKVTYTLSGHEYTANTKKVKFTVGPALFELADGVTSIDATEWTSGNATSFKAQLKWSDGRTEDHTNNASWTIIPETGEGEISENFSIDKGKISWNDKVSSNLNGKKFKVQARFTKSPTNSEYSVSTDWIIINVTDAQPTIVSPQATDDVFTVRAGAGRGCQWEYVLDAAFTSGVAVDPEGDITWELTEYDSRLDQTPYAWIDLFWKTTSDTENRLAFFYFPEVAENEPITFKIKASWKQKGRTQKYEVEKEFKVKTTTSAQTQFSNMEWAEICETLNTPGGLKLLKQKLDLPYESEPALGSLVGLMHKIKLSDTFGENDYTVVIADELHDSMGEEYANLSFHFISPLVDGSGNAVKRQWDSTIWPIFGGKPASYVETELYSYINSILSDFDSDVKNSIKKVGKQYEDFEEDGDSYKVFTKTAEMKLWLLSATEVGFSKPADYTTLGSAYWRYMEKWEGTEPDTWYSDYAFINPDAVDTSTWLRSVDTGVDDDGKHHYIDKGMVWTLSQTKTVIPTAWNNLNECFWFNPVSKSGIDHYNAIIIGFCI